MGLSAAPWSGMDDQRPPPMDLKQWMSHMSYESRGCGKLTGWGSAVQQIRSVPSEEDMKVGRAGNAKCVP